MDSIKFVCSVVRSLTLRSLFDVEITLKSTAVDRFFYFLFSLSYSNTILFSFKLCGVCVRFLWQKHQQQQPRLYNVKYIVKQGRHIWSD